MPANSSVVKHPESHDNCVMCGDKNNFSFRLSFESDATGKVFTTFQSFPELQGYAGQMHGGIISSLLDCAMTHCLFNRNIEAVTAELNVRFLKPVPHNSLVQLSAWVTEKIISLYKLKAELAVDGEVLARAESKFMSLQSS
jgi:acyl-coenzyme A thioesterase PaaI-like protein